MRSEDPELKPIFDEIRSGGMAAMMKVGRSRQGPARAGAAGLCARGACVGRSAAKVCCAWGVQEMPTSVAVPNCSSLLLALSPCCRST